MKNRTPRLAEEQKQKIAMDYVDSAMTLEETAKKYGLPSGRTIQNWVVRYGLRDKVLSLQQNPTNTNMPKRYTEEIKTEQDALERIRQLEMELGMAQLQIKALNTMIDIAEEQGYAIRKKSGAKQLNGCTKSKGCR